MIVISDTNILSSLAAADAFGLLFQLFSRTQICVPPSVRQELQAGLDRNQAHLAVIIQAIDADEVVLLDLSEQEQRLMGEMPRKLNAGERQAIAVARGRQAPLLSNDRRAVRYCEQIGVQVIDLPDILNLLWTRQVISQEAVRAIIVKLQDRENYQLTSSQNARVFSPPQSRRS